MPVSHQDLIIQLASLTDDYHAHLSYICTQATSALAILLDQSAISSSSDDRRALRSLLSLRASAMFAGRGSTGIALYTLDHVQAMMQQAGMVSSATGQAGKGDTGTTAPTTYAAEGHSVSDDIVKNGWRSFMINDRCKAALGMLARIYRDAPQSQPVTNDHVPDFAWWLADGARLESLHRDLSDMPTPLPADSSWWQTVMAFVLSIDPSSA